MPVANAVPRAADHLGDDVARFLIPPKAEPVPDAQSIAGWRSSSSSVLSSALQVMALAGDADVCVLSWEDDRDGLKFLDGTGPIAELDRGAWLDRVRGVPQGQAVGAGGGVVVAAVAGPDGRTAGALALRSRGGGESVEQLALLGAEHLGLLLASSEAHAERASAFEALFEIGTQIQAQEAHAESIFALIVERARELLGTDCAWMALVDETGNRLLMKVTAGTRSPDFARMEVKVGMGVGGIALKERRPVAVLDSSLYGNGMPRAVHRALDDEGVVSILCAPMLRDEGMLGALYVGNRTQRPFHSEESQLLSALAAQAAVTIENARLYSRLSEKNETLERAFSIHRLLTDAALAGGGLPGIASQLAILVDRDLLLSVTRNSPGHAIYRLGSENGIGEEIESEAAEAAAESAAASLPIVAGEDRLGTIHLLGAGGLSPLQDRALEHGATIIALELVKEQAALEVAWRLQGELLEELLGSPAGPVSDSLIARARRFDVDLERPRRLAVLAPDDEVAPSELLDFARHSMRCRPRAQGLVAQRGDRILIAIADDVPDGVRELIRDLEVRGRRAGMPFRCGLSNARTDLSAGLREATGALTLALRAPHSAAVISYEDLGPLRFMLDAPDTTGMVDLVGKTLGPLAAHDTRRHAELLPTLRAFLEYGGHHRTTAEACHVHVSTLKYRLGKIAEILDCDLRDATTRFELTLAFEVLGVLEVAGVAPFEIRAE